MSTVDYSQLTTEQIQEVLAQRRRELSEVTKVAKEKGIVTPKEAAPSASPEDQLRAGIQRIARSQFRMELEQKTRDRAQAAYTGMLGANFPKGLPKALEAELRGLYDATLQQQAELEQARRTKKAPPVAAPATNGAAEPEAAVVS